MSLHGGMRLPVPWHSPWQASSKPLSPVHTLYSLVVKSLRCGVEQSEVVTLTPLLKSDDGLEWVFQLVGTQYATCEMGQEQTLSHMAVVKMKWDTECKVLAQDEHTGDSP